MGGRISLQPFIGTKTTANLQDKLVQPFDEHLLRDHSVGGRISLQPFIGTKTTANLQEKLVQPYYVRMFF